MSHARGRRTSVGTTSFPGDEEAHLDRGIRLPRGEVERLSRLLGHDRGRLRAPLTQEECELAHDIAPLDGSPLGPRGLNSPSRSDGGGDILCTRPCDPA